MSFITFTRAAMDTITQARLAASTPVAVAPPPPPPPLVPTGTLPPALPGVLQQPSTAALYPSSAPGVTSFAPAMNVQQAAISPDPTALTGANLTPEQQSENRAKVLKLVAVAAVIWLILDSTGR